MTDIEYFYKKAEGYKRMLEDCPEEWTAQRDTIAKIAGHYDAALSALREAKERSHPKPLTLEELPDAIGEPVYEKDLGWFILRDVSCDEQIQLAGRLRTSEFAFYEIELYRQKPKEENE